jgi:formylglycine-generating enzyme required for sulfatase activity
MVKITRGYWIGSHQVSQKQWVSLMDENPSKITGSPYLPVNWVSWSEASLFCEKLTKYERANGRCPDGYEFRLPTEAEWEYACRSAGTGTAVVRSGKAGAVLEEVGVGSPNDLGLYGMLGNLPEWCLDVWRPYPAKQTEVAVDRFHPARRDGTKETFVVRGGGRWKTEQDKLSEFIRTRRNDSAGGFRGFRIVLGRTFQ